MDTTIANVVPEMQKAVNADFGVLDQRMNDFALKLSIKLGLIWLSSTVIAILLSELILHNVYKRAIKSRTFHEENTPRTELTPEVLNTITALIYQQATLGHAKPTLDQHPIDTKTTIPNPTPVLESKPTLPKKPGLFKRMRQKHADKKLQKERAKAEVEVKKQQAQTEKALQTLIAKKAQYERLQLVTQQLQKLDESIINTLPPNPTITERVDKELTSQYETQQLQHATPEEYATVTPKPTGE